MPIGTPFPEVLAAAQAGAGWAFEVMYRDLAPAVTAYLRLQGAAEPDDLASEIFIGAFHGLAAFRGDEARLRSWVFRLAREELIGDRRRRGRRPVPVQDGADALRTGTGDDDEMGARTVHRLCANLPDDQRDVLLLRILADLTVEQVAEVLDRTVPAVTALQRRALTTVRSDTRNAGDTAASR